VNGYYDTKLFKKWASSEFSFPAADLIEGLFLAMDADDNSVIDATEFKTRSDYFHFGFVQPSFEKWDKDSSGNLQWEEFSDGGEEAILEMWDFSGDENLSQREMADGIFLTYDKNHNGSWDYDEFDGWVKNRLR
jgi:Ca2+-binding EF-hand superfamily protein